MFDLGSTYPAALDVYNAAGVLTDPQTATLTITLPDGSVVSPTVPLPSTVPGQLRYAYPTTMAGRHQVRWQTTGPNLSYTDVFDVNTAAPPMILSLAMAKAQVQIDPSDTSNDDDIREMLMGVTQAIEDYKDEVIAQRTIVNEEHQFDLWSWSWQTPRLTLKYTPVIALQSLVSQDRNVTWNVADMDVDPTTGIITVIRGAPITGWVLATYTAGYQVIPWNYLEGAKVFFQWVWETRRGPGGLGGVVGPEELHSIAAHPYLIPRKAQQWLGPQFPAVA